MKRNLVKLIVSLPFVLFSSIGFAAETISVDQVFNNKTIQITSELYMPDAAKGKVPAMLILHGSGGVNEAYRTMAKDFAKMGVAGVVIDSFKPRGIGTTVEDQEQLSSYTMVLDANKVMREVARRSDIDASRIGLIGFSKGGTVVIKTALRHYADRLQRGDGFGLLIAVYPWCGDFPMNFRTTKASIHLMIGAEDTYAGVEPCQDYAGKMKAAGGDVSTKIYPGAKHGWIIPGRTSWSNPHGQNFSNCQFDEIAKGTWVERRSKIKTAEKDRLLPDGRRRATEQCMTHGVSGGYNAKAAEESLRDIRHYIRDAFRLTARP